MIIESLYNLVKGTAGKNQKKARAFFPIVSTFFIFIILSNWIGLMPGVGTIGFREVEEFTLEEEVHIGEEADIHLTQEGEAKLINENTLEEESNLEVKDAAHGEVEIHQDSQDVEDLENEHSDEEAMLHEDVEGEVHQEGEEVHHAAFVPYFRGPTADLNTTLALAALSVILIQYTGFKFLGFNYSKKFINFSGPIDFFVGFLELFSELSKIISFAFRLFGNIFAGEVLLTVIAFLMPVIAPLPFLGLEIFVGFIQALVFSMLTLVFLNIATISHDH